MRLKSVAHVSFRPLPLGRRGFDRAVSNGAKFHTGFTCHGRRLEPSVLAPARPEMKPSGERAFGPVAAETCDGVRERFAAQMTRPAVSRPVSRRAMRSLSSRRSKGPTFHHVAHIRLPTSANGLMGADYSEPPTLRCKNKNRRTPR